VISFTIASATFDIPLALRY